MSKSYEERMAEKYNFLKKDKNISSEVTNKNTEHDEQVSNDEVVKPHAENAKVHVIGGAKLAAAIDAKRAIFEALQIARSI